MRALCYLEWRYAVHAIAAIRRSPGRLALWIPYVLILGFSVFSRVYASRHGVRDAAGVDPRIATAIAGLYVALVGGTVGAAAGGRISTFRSPAEALLMSNAGVRPLGIAVWLQLRRLAGSWTRAFGGFSYLFLIFAPQRGDALATARAFVTAMLVIAVPLSAELPAFLIARGRWRAPVQIAAWSVAAGGVALGIVGFAGRRTWTAVVSAMHVDPGVIVGSVFSGDPKAMLVPLVCLALFVGIVALFGDDAIPELYSASRGRFALLQRAGTGRPPARVRTLRTSGRAHVPSGALALVWKDWLAFRRGFGVTLLLSGVAFWALCGAAAAYATLRFGDDTPLASVFVIATFAVIVWAPSTASSGLADDLQKPLFWLSHAPLRARLLAWTLGRTWRGGTTLAFGPVVAASVAGHPLLAVGALPVTLVAYWSLQALGIGLYAIFPTPLDARGPISLLRLLLTVAYLAPAAIVAGLGLAFGGGLLVAALAFAFAFGIEGWVVVELAALRFAENGASLGAIARAV